MTFVRLASSAWLFVVLAVASVVAAASCGYDDQSYEGVGFACDLRHACPEGFVCINGRCARDFGGEEPPPPAELGVNCGGIVCPSPTVCCNDFGGGIGVLVCLPAGSCGPPSRDLVTCDGDEDCGVGASCCTDGIGGTSCEPGNSCDADDQLCRTSFDCPVTAPFCCPSDFPTRPFWVCDSGC